MSKAEDLRGIIQNSNSARPVKTINQDQISDEQKLQQWQAYKLTDRYIIDMTISYGRVGL